MPRRFFRQYKKFLLLSGLLVVVSSPRVGLAAEISVFSFTEIEGDVGINYQSDELLLGPEHQSKTQNRLSTTREDVFIMTHSYVYHPNLLSMDIGAGISFVQNKLESTAGNVESDDELSSVSAKLRFLEKKPYPFRLYYDRANPMVTPSLTERFVQKNESYGLNASFDQSLLPVSLNLEAFHTSNEGSGITRVVDDSSDQVLFRAYRTIGEDGYGQLTYHLNDRISSSGVVGQPINKTEIGSESTSFDTHFSFGTTNQFRLSNLVSYFVQDNLPNQTEFRFVPNLSWQHTRDFSTYYRFDYLNNKIDDVESDSMSAAVGGRRSETDTVSTTSELHTAKSKVSGVENSSSGLVGSVSYQKPFGSSRLGLTMNLAYDRFSRNQGNISISREGHKLESASVALANNFVSQASISVVNENNQTMSLGGDYRITVIGNTTYIERVVGGNIAFGELVYVSYQYQSDAEVVYAVFNQSYGINLDLFKYYSLYTEYSDSDISEEEGSSSQISDVRRSRSGFRFEQPLFNEWMTLGGELIQEKQADLLSPYERDTKQLFVELEVFDDTRLRVSARKVEQDNIYSDEDVDLERQTARLVTRPWPRASLTFEMLHEKDAGGSVHRRIKEKSVVARWRVRKLVLEMDGRSISEIQGGVEREHNLFTAKLNREF